jgi:hypothetical protein
LLTLVNLARNGPALGVGSAGVLALAAELVLDELLLLLELPQPANASATPTRARIHVLGTGGSPEVRGIGIGRDGFPYDPAVAGFLPGELLGDRGDRLSDRRGG